MPNMSRRNEETPNSGEPVCMLCRQAQVDPDICGRTFASGGLCAHEFCLFFADGLLGWRCPMGGICGFSTGAIQHTIQLADQKHCFVCGGRGAAISCAETGCERSFHLPCAEDGQCVMQYFGQYRSFCWEHRPQQAAEAAPAQNTICIICLEPVGDSASYRTMLCPVCKQAWFHRGCIRRHAILAATARFYCPVCGERGRFQSQMTRLGIQIPIRRLSWWDDEAYQSLRERHSGCSASTCTHLGGRESAQEEEPCQPMLCSSCGSQGTRWCCSFWAMRRNAWAWDTCDVVLTRQRRRRRRRSSRTSRRRAATNRPRQRETGRTRSRSPLRGRASGSHSRPRRQRGGSRTTTRGAQSSTRTSARPAPSRSPRASPLPARRRQSRQRGRARSRSRSPLGRRASTSCSRPR
ncbi:PHD finger protein 7-like [Lagopus muta]|uniref:PHD finger protein 7-like n=1 Tax=Lagopus muta TaxID=64668 RepID=UPI0020A0E4D9|nr:PHD finger protein 7-like [Lagopus muta]